VTLRLIGRAATAAASAIQFLFSLIEPLQSVTVRAKSVRRWFQFHPCGINRVFVIPAELQSIEITGWSFSRPLIGS
jgi:hypothetical protein